MKSAQPAHIPIAPQPSPGQAPLPKPEEGLARVVELQGEFAWLEPMQGGSCAGCSSAGVCGGRGAGSLESRRASRRFAVKNEEGLVPGEFVLVDFGAEKLLVAAALAYLLPLACALLAAGLAQWLFGQDGLSLIAALLGLLPGYGLMRWQGARLQAQGHFTPRILQRLGQGETCQREDSSQEG